MLDWDSHDVVLAFKYCLVPSAKNHKIVFPEEEAEFTPYCFHYVVSYYGSSYNAREGCFDQERYRRLCSQHFGEASVHTHRVTCYFRMFTTALFKSSMSPKWPLIEHKTP